MPSAAVAVLLLAAGLASAGDIGEKETETRFKIYGSYRSDSLDFDDNAKEYILMKGSWRFSPGSSFNYARIRADNGARESSTWNLVLNDVSAGDNFIAGDYFTNFGSGLVIGKKSYFSSDIHSGGINESRMNPFTPCTSGNPGYSFHGAGISSRLIGGDDPLTVNFFYSLRSRYVEWDSYVANETSNSPGTVLGRVEGKQGYLEPVDVHDTGAMMEYRTLGFVKLQIYCAGSFMKSGGGSDFSWNLKKIDRGTSREKGFKTAGFFAEYKDDYIDIFTEAAFTSRDIYLNSKEHDSADYGVIGGVRFSHPVVKFSLTGKLTGEKFYSIYSSGNSGAERGMTGQINVRLTRRLRAGGEYSYQQALAYRIGAGIYPVKKRERIFSEYKFSALSSIESGMVRTETDSGAKISSYDKMSAKYIYNRKKISLSLNGSSQLKNSSDPSYSFGGYAGWKPVKEFLLSGEYSQIIAGESNPVYSSTGRAGFISGGSNVKQNCSSAALRALYKSERLNFGAGYSSVFTLNRMIDQRFDISAGAEF